MAVLLASNSSEATNKWVPYYWKRFHLGALANGTGSTDGNTYITQTTGTSAVAMTGFCISSHNCGYYYTLTFGSTGGDLFYVKKYTLDDTLVDTIYASETGEADDGKWWNKTTRVITIDVGVIVYIKDSSNYANNDVYKITLPSTDVMDRRRIWHGGYSTFIRMPYTEGIVYHSDIIPCNLKGRGMNINIGAYFTGESQIHASMQALTTNTSKEDTAGNSAVTCGLEWNLNPDGTHSNVAIAKYQVDFAVEDWALGTIFHDDIDPGVILDVSTNTHASSSDMTGALSTTGTASGLNVTVSGRAGHAKMYFSYVAGDGSPTILAYNQFWPVIITLT